MTSQPMLTTTRLRLTPPAPDRHTLGVFTYASDPRFTAHLAMAPYTEPAQATAFLESLAADNQAGRRLYWVIEDTTTGNAVGTLGFNFLFSASSRMADFGYGLAPSHWHGGYFREAASVVLNHAFTTLHLERIQVMTPISNTASIQGVKRLGFVEEGVLRAYYRLGDQRVDSMILGLLTGELTT